MLLMTAVLPKFIFKWAYVFEHPRKKNADERKHKIIKIEWIQLKQIEQLGKSPATNLIHNIANVKPTQVFDLDFKTQPYENKPHLIHVRSELSKVLCSLRLR